jgi:hypothetical protein
MDATNGIHGWFERAVGEADHPTDKELNND